MLQDAHTHFFSRTFFTTLAKLSPRDDSPEAILADVTGKTGLLLPEDDTAAHRDRWLAAMDAAGVERMVTFASVPPEVPVVAEAAAGSGGRLVPYTIVDPSADGALEFARKARGELGYRGLLTFPAMHPVQPSDERAAALYALAAEHGAPVIVHCGILKVKLRDLVGLPRRYDVALANPLHLVPAADSHPDTTFVLPHFGGGYLREALMAGDQCENICVDTSSSNVWTRTHPGLALADVFAAALDVLGPERILFGTDSGVFPRGYRGDLVEEQTAALATAGASDADVEAIMGRNLERLLPRD